MPVQTDTTIQFSGLKPGTYDFDFTLERAFFERFENDELSDGKVHFYVHLERKERLLLFTMAFDGKVLTQCDRCLGDMEVAVRGKHLLTVQIVNADQPIEEGDDVDTIQLPDKESQIDLAQWMYEYVMIALPMQHIHPADADGRPTCDPEMLRLLSQHLVSEDGTHDETAADTAAEGKALDPRWAKLMELK